MPAAATTRVFLGTVASQGCHVEHLDIKTAFLYAPMDMEVCIVIPEGFEDAGEDDLLLMAMYGTTQVGNLWGKHLHGKMIDEDGVQSTSNKCFYHFQLGENVFKVEVYEDDLAVAGACLEVVLDVTRRNSRHFEVRDLGEIRSFLGIQLVWVRKAGPVALSNPRRTVDLLKEFEMDNFKLKHTPMVPGAEQGQGEPLPEGNRLAELVGSVMYLTNQTRPDIAYAVGRLAQCMSTPTECDWRAAKRVLRYLQGSREYGIIYGGQSDLEGWVDADFAGDPATRKSTTGFQFTLHGGAILWRSRCRG